MPRHRVARQAIFVPIEFSRERAFDVAGTRVVSFDEIAVVGVHDAHDVRKVSNPLWRVLDTGRLDPLDTFEGTVWPICWPMSWNS